MNRPKKPPQTMKIGDEWSYDVEIMLDGKLATDMCWIEVSPTKGTRYTGEIEGNFDMAREEIEGNFEIVWRDGL